MGYNSTLATYLHSFQGRLYGGSYGGHRNVLRSSSSQVKLALKNGFSVSREERDFIFSFLFFTQTKIILVKETVKK